MATKTKTTWVNYAIGVRYPVTADSVCGLKDWTRRGSLSQEAQLPAVAVLDPRAIGVARAARLDRFELSKDVQSELPSQILNRGNIQLMAQSECADVRLVYLAAHALGKSWASLSLPGNQAEGHEDTHSELIGDLADSGLITAFAKSHLEAHRFVQTLFVEGSIIGIQLRDQKTFGTTDLEMAKGGSAWFHHSGSVHLRRRTTFDQRTLTDPEQILMAFADPRVTGPARRHLVLFAETLRFSDRQQLTLVPHLWSYVAERRTSQDEDELVALGSAIRKLIAYLPSQRLDDLAVFLEFDETGTVRSEVELEVVKGLVYRFSWDSQTTWPSSPRLCESLIDLANFHSSKRAVEQDLSSAIAVNAIIALAFLNDSRIATFVRSLPKHSLSWFAPVVHARSQRLLTRLKKERRGNTDTLGLLPQIVGALALHEGK